MNKLFKKYLEAKLGYEIEGYTIEDESKRDFKFGIKEKRTSTGIREIKIIPKKSSGLINIDVTILKTGESE